MKKAFIVCSVFLLFTVTTSAQTPTYKELSATAYRLLKEQDYIGAQGKRGQVIFALSDPLRRICNPTLLNIRICNLQNTKTPAKVLMLADKKS